MATRKGKELDVYLKDAQERGATDAVVISPSKVFTAAWVRLRCQYGCSEYGQCLTCPPHSPTPETTRRVLDEYRSAILLHGSDWAVVRDIGRVLEQKIFLDGFYKAFSFLCGPCWMCKNCALGHLKQGKPIACRHPDLARPSMEGAGIDVYATAHAAGLPIEVVRSEECPQNYYALVLVE
jgi:predicted metal-binding protein